LFTFVGNKNQFTMKTVNQHSIGRESVSVEHIFSDEEMNAIRTKHADLCLEEQIMSDDLREHNKYVKSQVKDLKERMRTELKLIRKGSEQREVMCELVPDYKNNIMQFVDDAGTIVHSRRLKPNERQTSIPVERIEDDKQQANSY
jgi:hypothetical protein